MSASRIQHVSEKGYGVLRRRHKEWSTGGRGGGMQGMSQGVYLTHTHTQTKKGSNTRSYKRGCALGGKLRSREERCSGSSAVRGCWG